MGAPWGTGEGAALATDVRHRGNNEPLLKTIDHVTSDGKGLRRNSAGQACLHLRPEPHLADDA